MIDVGMVDKTALFIETNYAILDYRFIDGFFAATAKGQLEFDNPDYRNLFFNCILLAAASVQRRRGGHPSQPCARRQEHGTGPGDPHHAGTAVQEERRYGNGDRWQGDTVLFCDCY